MSFKFQSVLSLRNILRCQGRLLSLLVLSCSCLTLLGIPETVDRIVAVVNDQVITLTDLRIIRALALYEEEMEEDKEVSPSSILDKLIDQKLVIQLSGEDIDIGREEVEASIKALRQRLGDERVQEILSEFGLQQSDLAEYIHERMLYKRLLTQKFGKGAVVRLDEIESYYKETYVPAQKKKGLEPQPMIELLREIESKIIERKIQNEIEDWLKNLRAQADIQIKAENLDEYFKE